MTFIGVLLSFLVAGLYLIMSGMTFYALSVDLNKEEWAVFLKIGELIGIAYLLATFVFTK
jgi:hypothetical protein